MSEHNLLTIRGQLRYLKIVSFQENNVCTCNRITCICIDTLFKKDFCHFESFWYIPFQISKFSGNTKANVSRSCKLNGYVARVQESKLYFLFTRKSTMYIWMVFWNKTKLVHETRQWKIVTIKICKTRFSINMMVFDNFHNFRLLHYH